MRYLHHVASLSHCAEAKALQIPLIDIEQLEGPDSKVVHEISRNFAKSQVREIREISRTLDRRIWRISRNYGTQISEILRILRIFADIRRNCCNIPGTFAKFAKFREL